MSEQQKAPTITTPLAPRLEILDRRVRRDPGKFEQILVSDILPLAEQNFTNEVAELPSGMTIVVLSESEIRGRMASETPPGSFSAKVLNGHTAKIQPGDPGEVRLNKDALLRPHAYAGINEVIKNPATNAYGTAFHEFGHAAAPITLCAPEDLTTPMATIVNGDTPLTFKYGLQLLWHDNQGVDHGVYFRGMRSDEEEALIEFQMLDHLKRRGVTGMPVGYPAAELYERRLVKQCFPKDHNILSELRRLGEQIEFFKLVGLRFQQVLGETTEPVALGETVLYNVIRADAHFG